MACIITYENKQYTQKEFEQYFKEHFTEFVGEFIDLTHTLKTSLGKELEYKDPYVPQSRLKSFKQYEVLNENGDNIGTVVVEYRGNESVILHPKLNVTDKGYGKDLYKLISSKFNVEVQEWSEGAIANSDSAKKMWDSLEKEGSAKRIIDAEQGDNFRVLNYRRVGSKQDIEGFEQYLTLNINSEIQKNDGNLQQTLGDFYSSLNQDQLSKIPSIEQVKEEILESIYDDSDIIEMLKCKI